MRQEARRAAIRTNLRRAVIGGGLTLVVGCSSTAPVGNAGGSLSPGAALLLRDNATVAMTFQSGPGSTAQGRRGRGLFTNTYRATTNTFGPAEVLSHTPSALTFRTSSTTCTLATEGVVTCRDGSRGSWNAV